MSARVGGTARRSSLYARVWRWHFFAGLFVAPFACLLALSGSVYLFKPQLDAALDGWAARGALAGAPLPEQALLDAVLAERPGATLGKYVLPRTPDALAVSMQLRLPNGGGAEQVWVERASGKLLYAMPVSSMPLELAKTLHGELFGGDWGSALVELAASWLIILTLSGLYLSWPRGKSLFAVLLPKLDFSSRLGLRNFHGALGIFAASGILLFLASGLPWTGVWGKGFDVVQNWVEGADKHAAFGFAPESHPPEHHMGGGAEAAVAPAWNRSSSAPEPEAGVASSAPASVQGGAPPGGIGLGDVVARIAGESLVPPIEISPPRGENGVWSVRSMTQRRPDRVTVHFDRWSGAELLRTKFDDQKPIARAVGYGLSLHEGALFGPLNQLFGVLVALGVIGLSATGVLAWWRRRPRGVLAAPPLPAELGLARGVAVLVLGLAVFLPLVGASLLLVLAVEFLWGRASAGRGPATAGAPQAALEPAAEASWERGASQRQR